MVFVCVFAECATITLVSSLARADEDAWSLVDSASSGPSATLTGDFQSRSSLDTVWDDVFEDVFATRELFYAAGKFRESETLSVTMSALLDYEYRMNREGRTNGARFDPRVEELYGDLHFGKLDVRLGQQIVTWGKTDVISPTDTINSQRFSKAIDTELGHYKVPNLMAKADWFVGPAHLEGVFIPFMRPAEISFIGGDWSLIGNRVPVGMATGYLDESEQGRSLLRFLDQWSPHWDDRLADTLSDERINAFGPTTPSDDLEHWEAAARAGVSAGRVDGSISYIYAFEDLPALYFQPALIDLVGRDGFDLGIEAVRELDELNGEPLLASEYQRSHQVGADFQANLGPSVLRAEAAYSVPRHLYDDHLRVVEKPMLTATASADYTWPSINTVLNAQVLEMHTVDWTEDLLSERSYTFLISYIRGAFNEDRGELYAQILYNVSAWSMDKAREADLFGEDLQFSSRLSYDVRQDLELALGVIAFGGPRDRLLAFAHARSFAFLDVKYSF